MTILQSPSPQTQAAPLPVVSALIMIDGKFPVFRRHKGEDSWWDLPGGKQDSPQESYADTILRELNEELGITACVINENPALVTDHPYIRGSKKIYMVCRHTAGQAHNALPEEHDELRLVDAAEAVSLLGTYVSPQVAQAILDLDKAARASKPASPATGPYVPKLCPD